ncbi:MAG: HEAT repeat domain-containing protein [Anaerolineae bacterium]|nr:HEAT repeat domain-containing protein [Anaerolineae bacterium]MCC7189646.1 HEAT repeat domain-containing protein [Anaerolineales bacterium]
MNLKQNINRLIFMLLAILTSCNQMSVKPTPSPEVEASTLPTPASTLADLLKDLKSDDVAVRLSSIYALEKYGDAATVAIPALIDNLYINDADVRKAAADALGKFGPGAKSAIPDLIHMLRNDSYYHARAAAADALGLIGDPQAVPDLVATLFEEQTYQLHNLEISCAESIAKITGEKFREAGSKGVYSIDNNGLPLIVIDAREWWLNVGQFEDWSKK